MPAMIQVVLTEDVDKLGASGQLVRVRPGYARNFLIPRKLAVPATTSAINRIEHAKAVALARAEKQKKASREIADKLSALEITIQHAAGEDGKLFGSVTSKHIHAAAKAKGIDFDKKKIQLDAPLRELGTFEVPVKLMSDISATLKVHVVTG